MKSEIDPISTVFLLQVFDQFLATFLLLSCVLAVDEQVE